jgi:hypothetical protein
MLSVCEASRPRGQQGHNIGQSENKLREHKRLKNEVEADDWRENPAVVAIVEAALLSVIRVHSPMSGTAAEDERKRLNDAKSALFGFKTFQGRPKDRDIPELVYMAQEYIRERGDYSFDSDYIPKFSENDAEETGYQTELARRAIATRRANYPGYRPHNEEEKIRNLQQKFDVSREELIRRVVGWGGTNGDLIQMHVRDLAETLRVLGIPPAAEVDQDRELNSLI